MMIAASAAILVAVNVGVFMASSKGSIGPIDNMVLWAGFVALNTASILWAASLLGLQPLVVSTSYVAGGCLAFLGVRGMNGVSVAEITTAGATYGAFGALAIGNMTAKVRLAFFNKGQMPFIFIIVGLLVVDGLLNSQVSSAGGTVLLNAVLFPFMLAGVVLGLVWSVLNRFGIGRKPSEVLAEKDAYFAEAKEEKANAVEEKMVFQVPAHAAMEAAAEPDVQPEPAKRVEIPEPLAPAAKAEPKQTVLAEAPSAKPKKEEEFFPLEIDKGDAVMDQSDDEETLKNLVSLMEDDEPEDDFSMPTFDESLYASGSLEDEVAGGVMVEEPKVEVKTETEPAKPVVEKPPVVAEVKPEPRPEPKLEAKPEPTPEPKAEAAPKKEEKSDDWLGGHLDLLNKLK